MAQNLSYEEYFIPLLEEELKHRQEAPIRAKVGKAKFPFIKTMEEFEFSFQPALKEREVIQLASLQFIELKENVILLGPPGIFFGGGPGGLSAQLGIPLKNAYDINEAYTNAYKMVSAFAFTSGRSASTNGYTETLFRRRRYMEDFQASDPKARARGKRLSVNLQIQGGALDIAKIGLIRQDTARQKFDEGHGCTTHLCNFIHDLFVGTANCFERP